MPLIVVRGGKISARSDARRRLGFGRCRASLIFDKFWSILGSAPRGSRGLANPENLNKRANLKNEGDAPADLSLSPSVETAPIDAIDGLRVFSRVARGPWEINVYGCWNARAVGLDLTAEETIEIASRAGFEGVDLLVRDIIESGADVDQLRRRMDDLGLRGGGWPLPVNWRGDDQTFEADLKRLPQQAETAARLGLSRTGTWVRFESDPVDSATRNDKASRQRLVESSTARQVDRLGQIAKILGDHGSRIGLEIIGSRSEKTGRGIPLVGTYAELTRRFGALRDAHSNVSVLVDAFHLFASGESLDDALAWGPSSVVWVHLADPSNHDRETLRDLERALPGESPLSLCAGLLSALARDGCRAPVTVEPLGRCRSLENLDPLASAMQTRAALRRVWPSAPS